jgi:hypothetical protein
MAFIAPFIAPLRLECLVRFGSSFDPSASPPAIPAAAAVPTSAGTFAFPAAEPIELTPALTPEPIDSLTVPTESPTEPMTPVLLRSCLAVLGLFRLLGPGRDREEPARLLDDPLGREAVVGPFAPRFAATLEPPRAETPLLPVVLRDLPFLLALVLALFVVEAVRA